MLANTSLIEQWQLTDMDDHIIVDSITYQCVPHANN